MKYENANDILPEELLKEIQKYAGGKLLYIPAGVEKRAWGETSGYREHLQKRNRMIRNKYAHGLTVSELADESEDDVFALPPLLIEYGEGKFYCTAQQELLASLKRRKINAYPTAIVLKGNAEYKRFMKYYGNKFIYVDKV